MAVARFCFCKNNKRTIDRVWVSGSWFCAHCSERQRGRRRRYTFVGRGRHETVQVAQWRQSESSKSRCVAVSNARDADFFFWSTWCVKGVEADRIFRYQDFSAVTNHIYVFICRRENVSQNGAPNLASMRAFNWCVTLVVEVAVKSPPPPQNTSAVVGNLK